MKLDRFINRPVLSTVISIIIVILGLIGLVSLPISQYPDIAPPTISVRTTYTGANAQTVLNSVVAPLEEAINGVENMTYMTSQSTNQGSATITIYFDHGVDPDQAAVNVQNKVSTATGLLPAEVVQVGVTTLKRQTSMLEVFTVYSTNSEYDETFLQNYLEINLIPQVQRVSGVGEAFVWGAHDYSMRIWLKPDVMAKYALEPSDITAALATQNIEAAPGQFGQQGNQSFQYVLTYKGRLQEVPEFENIILRAETDGQILRLGDVARVELGSLDYSIHSTSMGYPGMVVGIYQTAGSNATTVIENINALLEEASKDFPEGMEYVILLNSNDFLYASIEKVIRTLIEAFILVFLVVYIFLQDFRSTLIPAIAVPVAIIGTFFFLYIVGFTINLLTLFALVLAIAIVVDDAIVVVEAVHAKLDQGYTSARKATIDAMNEISGAIIAITLVMASVFLPVTFIEGTTGTFYTQFGITLAFAILISAVNALTLSPALCALFLKPHTEQEQKKGKKKSWIKRFHEGFNKRFNTLLDKYEKGVNFFIGKKLISFLIIGVFVFLLVYLLMSTPTGLVPNEDQGMVMIDVALPPASSLERTTEIMNRADSIIAGNSLIQARTKIVGSGLISGTGSSYGAFFCKLTPWDERKGKESSIEAVTAQLTQQLSVLKDARFMVFSPPQIAGFGISGGFEFSMEDRTGGDINQFYQVTQQFLAQLNQRPEIQYAATTFNPNFPQYMVDIDEARAIQAGTTPQNILATLQGYYGGIYASNFNRFGKLYRVMIQADTLYRISPETLNNIYVHTGTTMSPISEFVTLTRTYGPESISRFNMFNSIPVNGAPAYGYSSGDALNAIREVAETDMPTGYDYEFSGLSREEDAASNTVVLVFALCLIFVYFLLSAQYESYLLPLAVILSIPFGLAGTFIFARLMGINNNVYLQIALIMLIGLLAKNAILIIQFAVERRAQGKSIVEAAVLGAAARLRPILMTSLALIIGLLPLMFASGVGANGNRSIGSGAIGGMLIGMIFQIFIVPVLYVVFQSLQERFGRSKHKEEGLEKEEDTKLITEHSTS